MSDLTKEQLFVMTDSPKCAGCGDFCQNTPIPVDGKLFCKNCVWKAQKDKQ